MLVLEGVVGRGGLRRVAAVHEVEAADAFELGCYRRPNGLARALLRCLEVRVDEAALLVDEALGHHLRFAQVAHDARQDVACWLKNWFRLIWDEKFNTFVLTPIIII